MHLQREHLTSTFEGLGVSVNDFLTAQSLKRNLDELNGNTTFDEFIFDELWGQCRENSLAQVRLGDFVEVIMKAKQRIFEQNTEAVREIERLREEIKRAQGEGGREVRVRVKELEDKIDDEKRNKLQINHNLQILDKLFANSKPRPPNPKSPSRQYKQYSLPNQPFLEPNQQQHNDLRCILFITIPMILCQCFLMFLKTDFLNLLTYIFILTTFLIVNADRTYIRFTIGIIILSCATDILWVLMYAGRLWSTPKVSEYSKDSETFRRVVLVSTIALMAGKVFIAVLLMRYRAVEGVLRIAWLNNNRKESQVPGNKKKNFVTQALQRVKPQPALIV